MYTLKNLAASFILLTLFVSCAKDEVKDTINNALDDGTGSNITAIVNGEDFATTNLESTITAQMELITINGSEAYFLSIAGVSVLGPSLEAIGISFGDENFDELEVGKVHVGIATDSGLQYALGTYQLENGNETGASATTENTDNATVTITALDKANNTISGEFSFVAVDTDTGESFAVTEGKFTNITYSTE